MKRFFYLLTATAIAFLWLFPRTSFSQEIFPGEHLINENRLKSYVTFLASPLLNGRENGEQGLEIAQQFVISQAMLAGLNPANGNSYLQPYQIIETSFDESKSLLGIKSEGGAFEEIDQNLIQIMPSTPSDFAVNGEVVFAGYGLKQMMYDYNDYANIDISGKIVLVMDGAPTSADGEFLFKGNDWSAQFASINAKISYVTYSKAKAVIIVPDPKSGATTTEQLYPGIENQFKASRKLKGDAYFRASTPNTPVIMMANSEVADRLLEGSGHTLKELQLIIDDNLKPYSFVIPDKEISIMKSTKTEEKTLYNVAAIIEGSDPILQDEYLVFSSHIDHVGSANGIVYPGADDNATGCAALLAMAKAFSEAPEPPKRSLLFLWFSGEEIGLFGSRAYVENPLVPLSKSVANINIDMIGRSKGVADTSKNNPMTGPTGVFVISGNQSKELLEIADKIDKESAIDFDYSQSGRQSELQLFSRSDHYNFVRHDIPVLFFFTGLHTDYHTPHDTVDKIEFDKMEEIVKTTYRIGYTIANKPDRLNVDNPFSEW